MGNPSEDDSVGERDGEPSSPSSLPITGKVDP